ncbi:cytochrome-c peroxidase [Candidatus Manganitrophus noduliformans]|uniref:Cytochrome-c peroxidase n=1 Tax=Candidatus Manganitrophus noduliformans TaxID=2606439 RepID=A0A7X6IDC0_9BACT|nr:cytochrome-c peroxidase [Candidatus Manganitrophus noduliformans]NKE73299.1 cytochrome-c peroxidase [Candidatus Manganitrophus noduliformans]
MRRFILFQFSSVWVLVFLITAPAFGQEADLIRQAGNFFKPLPEKLSAPENNPATPEKVLLGQMLFFEPRLSKSGAISCNSCHNLITGGVDNLPTSPGHMGQLGGRNSPTVLNAGVQFAQFWDGRAASLEDQAKGPILNPVEMAMPDESSVLARLRSIPEYVALFKKAFPGEKEPLTYDNVAKAIAAFERTLLTPSRFDDFLKGNAKALTDAEKKGLQLVIQKGCIACHNGVGAGGGQYQKFGIAEPYASSDDPGRFNVTKKETDRFIFKVPLWRNVTRTAPYFHDGAVWDLREAVRTMGKLQLKINLTEEEIDLIVAFLHSLEGTVPEAALKLPVLPTSASATPKPVLK